MQNDKFFFVVSCVPMHDAIPASVLLLAVRAGCSTRSIEDGGCDDADRPTLTTTMLLTMPLSVADADSDSVEC